MAAKKAKRKPGPPARYGRRHVLTIRAQQHVYRAIQRAATAHGKSLSEEIEDRLETGLDLETARHQLEQMREATTKMHAMAASVLSDAAEERSAARVMALRLTGFELLRSVEGKPTRITVDVGLLRSETDSFLRSGFLPNPAAEQLPPRQEPQAMTAEENERLLREIELLRATIADLMKRRDGEAA
jgi:hypothetical protein